MNDKEYTVKNAEHNLHIAQTKLTDAMEKLRLTRIRLQADMDREIGMLANDVKRAELDCQKDKTYLELTLSNLERGFDQ